ncbi:coiled-coil domain-containing protein 115-like [Cimex lectularius]|uniref:Vacuolar ATPase assembly protein VMA22 n=1 Tax=Cimex lectularius TaxID=79782 RepID=A0A8I6TH19_CIMLE|nr:coiled-coil domain-containing protein 115-like [Cimex lectularius]
MGRKEGLESVLGELDILSFRMLQLMKDYIDVKLTLEELIKTGSLHLAKSRYIMGNRSVSVLQLPTEECQLNALVRVVEKDQDVDGLSLELNKLDLKGKDEKGTKQRKKADETSDDETELDVKVQDPIKWFGVLTPQNLRQAQSSFAKALEYSVQCANLQLEMKQVQMKYKELIEEKNKLMKVEQT